MLPDAPSTRSGKLSKVHLKYARRYTLLDQMPPGRAPQSQGTESLPISLRASGILLNNFGLIWVIPPSAQKYSAFLPPNTNRVDRHCGVQ